MRIIPCECANSTSNYVCKKYKFKVDKAKGLSIFIFAALWFLFVILSSNVEPQITRMLLSRIQILWIVNVITRVYILGLSLLIWIVTFNLTGTDCTVIMHEKYMDITIGEVSYSIKYRDISYFTLGSRGYNIRIWSCDGLKINLLVSLRCKIRDMIAIFRFMNALDKKLKKY